MKVQGVEIKQERKAKKDHIIEVRFQSNYAKRLLKAKQQLK